MQTLWGIDLGGTKIEGVAIHPDDARNPICRMRIETQAEQGYAHILSQIANLISKMREAVGSAPSVIGLGHPGSTDPKTGLLKNSNTTCLNDKRLVGDLSAHLGLEVVAANDANCFALAEASFGAAKGAPVVFGVIMGTGVGGGIVINGRVLQGCQGIAGEWGHNILIEDGPPCYCGKRGCVEAVISGPALEKYYTNLSGTARPLEEICSLALDAGDIHAVQTLHRLCFFFGKALAVVINILDPDVIVLGGGLSNIPCLYSEGICAIGGHLFNPQLETKIVKNSLGDSAGVFGAAMLTHSWSIPNRAQEERG